MVSAETGGGSADLLAAFEARMVGHADDAGLSIDRLEAPAHQLLHRNSEVLTRSFTMGRFA